MFRRYSIFSSQHPFRLNPTLAHPTATGRALPFALRALHLACLGLAALPLHTDAQANPTAVAPAPIASGAVSQSTSSDTEATKIEPITITGARKRVDNLQETPQSATVLSKEQIKDARIRSVEQLQAYVPNFRVSSSGGRGNKGSIAIRGFFNTDFSKDPSVGLYIDDMPFSDLSTYSSILFDMQSIEVLRGPQSTLYGANTPAGAINITTAAPSKTFAGEAELEYGNYNTRLARAIISGPIGSPELTASLAVAKEKSDGFITNRFNNTAYNQQDTEAVRAKLRWQPNAQWDVNLLLQQRNIADTGAPYHYLPLSAAAYAATVAGAPLLGRHEVWLNTPGVVGQKEASGSFRVGFTGEHVQFSSITSSRTQKNYFRGYDVDDSAGPVDLAPLFGTPPGAFVAPGLEGGFAGGYKQQTQEFRLQSPPNGSESFVWIVGAYTSREREDGEGGIAVLPGPESPFFDLLYNNRSRAVFGQTTLRFFNDTLGLTTGIRYETVKRQGSNTIAKLDETVTSNQWLPRFGADIRATSNVMIYTDIARGWKPAGVVPEAPFGQPFTYRTEITTASEVGAKTQWLNKRLSINAALFLAEAKGYQDTVRVTPLIRYLTNVEKVRSRGAELEAQWRPSSALELGVTAGYVDARYLKYQNLDGTRFDGNRVVLTPTHSVGASATWRSESGVFMRGDVTRFGDYFYDRENTVRQNGYTMLNAKLGYKQTRWEAYIYGENLTNARYFERIFPGTIYSGVNFGPPEKPRRFGIGLTLTL